MRALPITGALAAASVLVLSACSGGGGGQPSSSGSGSIDVWVRSTTAGESQALVDAFNASHDTQVSLTVIPQENYLQRVSTAAGSQELPCLMASDVVYMPNFIQNGLFEPITDEVEQLGFADSLAPGLMDLSTQDGEVYALPHVVALSAIFQNDVVLEKAGIDPAAPIATLQDLADNVRTVGELGGDVIPLYFAGNAGNSIAFTHFPAIWASGGEVISADGATSLLDSDVAVDVFSVFHDLASDGLVPTSAANETGATRNDVFAGGNVAYMLSSNGTVKAVPDSDAVHLGVKPIPGLDGGTSTFLGGDVIGITTSCSDTDAAWEFLDWSVQEEAQVDVYAANDILTVRSDLADNEHTADDPIALALNSLVGEGRTPYSLHFGQTFNDPNGPALSALRSAIFDAGTSTADTLREYNPQISASLAG